MTGASKMRGAVIRFYEVATDPRMPGRLPTQPPEGAYLRGYDNDANDGRGDTWWTTNPAEAMVFVSSAAAHAAWTSQSRVRPLRPDGKPNRPLTAFTIIVEPAP